MKIKLAMLESDSGYIRRIVPVLHSRYANEIEVYSFTDVDAAMECLEEKKIDIFLSSDSFKIDFSAVPKRCGFAYLVESPDIHSIDDKQAICKYQKPELIVKQVMSMYSEHIPNVTGAANDKNGNMKTIAFCSPCGGTGTSTAAAACAIALAAKGYRVLYLNSEIYGDADLFFASDGQFDFSDVIYAVKSNKSNRALKLRSTVKQDSSGVYFYSSVKVPLDMMEMTAEDYKTLYAELAALGAYDYVVCDTEIPKTHSAFEMFNYCNSVVIVSDGRLTASSKLKKLVRTVQILDGQSESGMMRKMWLLNNKSVGRENGQSELRVLGSFPVYQTVAPAQLAKQLSMSNIFVQLI